MKNIDLHSLLYDSSKACIEKATVVVLKDTSLINGLVDLSFKEEPKYSARATRVIYNCALNNPVIIEPFIEKIISGLGTLKADNLKGNFIGLFANVLLPEDEELIGTLASRCFEFINSKSKTESLAVYSIDVLYKISNIYPEIKNELRLSIENQMQFRKPAFQNRGKRVLDKLYKEIGKRDLDVAEELLLL